MTDPVRDAMRMVYVDGFNAGVRSERQKRRSGAFVRGVIVGVLIAVAGIGVAVAQTIPERANAYRRDLTKLSRSVWGMDAPVSNLAAQIHQESGWNANAVSRVGAAGLAQFMPSTAASLAREHGDVALPFDPRWSMLYQSRYMKRLYESVDGVDDCERYAFALAAYNGGLKWVYRRQQLSANPGVCLFGACELNPGIHPANQRENADYPKRILLRLTPLYEEALWGPARCSP